MTTVDKCSECPFRNEGDWFTYCNIGHFDLYEYEDFPDNCPLLRGSITVNICDNPKIGKKVIEYKETEFAPILLVPYKTPYLGLLTDTNKNRTFTYKEDDIPPEAPDDNG